MAESEPEAELYLRLRGLRQRMREDLEMVEKPSLEMVAQPPPPLRFHHPLCLASVDFPASSLHAGL